MCSREMAEPRVRLQGRVSRQNAKSNHRAHDTVRFVGAIIMVVKRIFDVLLSATAILLTLPLWLVVGLAVKLGSRGPIFYKSERVGRNGVHFWLYKFRSMRVDADKNGQVISAAGDPRQTWVGRLLRHWKIDELPNFLNVLKGDMSVVGPRPEAPKYVASFSDDEKRVLAVRPGITDMAVSSKYRDEQRILGQVDDPEEYYRTVILRDFLAMNLKYVDEPPSLARDLAIIMQTIRATLLNHATPVEPSLQQPRNVEHRQGTPTCRS